MAKRILPVILAVGIFFLPTGVSRAQNDTWITHGPYGGDIKALVLDRANTSVVYAGLEAQGVWKSVDGGENWSPASAGLGDLHILALEQDPHVAAVLYAGTKTGVYKSADAGVSWQLSDSLNTEVRAFAFDLNSPQHIYGATKLGLFESPDAGISWQHVNADSLESEDLWSVLVNATDSTVYVGTYKSGVFKRGQQDTYWRAANNGLDVGSVDNLKISELVIKSAAKGEMLAATRGGGVFLTTNGGDVWTSISNQNGMFNKYILDIAVDPYNDNNLYVASNREGVFKSTDGGGQWKQMVTGLAIKPLNGIKVSPAQPSLLFAGSFGGVFKSSNGGARWNESSNGIMGVEITALINDLFTNNLLYAGTSKGGVLKSTDGGVTWVHINEGFTSLGVMDLLADPVAAGTIYAGVWESGVYKLTAGSTKWVEIGLDDMEIRDLVIDKLNPAVFYVATSDSGIIKTNNRGQTWTKMGLSDLEPRAVIPDLNTPNVVYAGTRKAGVMKSFNGGTDWFASTTGITNPEVRVLAVDPLNSLRLYAATWGGGLFRTDNEGADWLPMNTGLTDKYIKSFAIDPSNPLTLYIGTNSGGVFKSVNGGESWSPLMNGLEDKYIPALAIDPFQNNVLYAGTSAGVHKMIQTTSYVQKAKSLFAPREFALGQNYPNPFNPVTMIDFSVRKSGPVSIVVYDLLGKEVMELLSSSLSAGAYKVTWDGRDSFGREVAGGVYFYQMKAEGLQFTRKMIFSK